MNFEDLKKYYTTYHNILKSNENDIIKITSQLEKLDKIFNRKKNEEPKENVKVVEYAEIEPEILWPLNLIFSKKNLMKYKLLYRQLLRLKFIEKLFFLNGLGIGGKGALPDELAVDQHHVLDQDLQFLHGLRRFDRGTEIRGGLMNVDGVDVVALDSLLLSAGPERLFRCHQLLRQLRHGHL